MRGKRAGQSEVSGFGVYFVVVLFVYLLLSFSFFSLLLAGAAPVDKNSDLSFLLHLGSLLSTSPRINLVYFNSDLSCLLHLGSLLSTSPRISQVYFTSDLSSLFYLGSLKSISPRISQLYFISDLSCLFHLASCLFNLGSLLSISPWASLVYFTLISFVSLTSDLLG